MTQSKPNEPKVAAQQGLPPELMEVLLQATEEVLAEHGREGVTPLRIASRAGVSIGSLYQCFRHKDALVQAALERRQKHEEKKKVPPPPPPAKVETLEEAVGAVVNRLVSAFANSMATMESMSKADRDAVYRAELKRMADASRTLMTEHNVPGAAQAAHIMTLSCSKVVKDAMSNAPESFTDGRLQGALFRLCLDFVRSEQK